MATSGDLTFTVDIQKIVSDQLAAIRAAVDEGCKEILREAFEAGYDKGFRTGAYGPDEFGKFEEWIEDFIETHREA